MNEPVDDDAQSVIEQIATNLGIEAATVESETTSSEGVDAGAADGEAGQEEQ
ncbi:hypothetical protein [Lignipirellula cremea]|uniref:hypothetical protein n=1 Tax=Lignipirellula cremea TaxID=2528010 RepID=UPI0018D20463|nr:hypothetical protein [Lignipirellula cremea]